MNNRKLSEKILDLVLEELVDRNGLGDAWKIVSAPIKERVVEVLLRKLENLLESDR